MSGMLRQPAGPNERHWFGCGSTAALTCEVCGTDHPDLSSYGDSRGFGDFLGLQIVGPCCGAVIDQLYAEFGNLFFNATLEDFMQDPLSSDHEFLRQLLKEATERWHESAIKHLASGARVCETAEKAANATERRK